MAKSPNFSVDQTFLPLAVHHPAARSRPLTHSRISPYTPAIFAATVSHRITLYFLPTAARSLAHRRRCSSARLMASRRFLCERLRTDVDPPTRTSGVRPDIILKFMDSISPQHATSPDFRSLPSGHSQLMNSRNNELMHWQNCLTILPTALLCADHRHAARQRLRHRNPKILAARRRFEQVGLREGGPFSRRRPGPIKTRSVNGER